MPPSKVEEAVLEVTLKRLALIPPVKVEVAVVEATYKAPVRVEVPVLPMLSGPAIVVDPDCKTRRLGCRILVPTKRVEVAIRA